MASCLLRKWGQCRVPATFGGRAPFPSRLGCRALLAYMVPFISRFVRLSRESRDSRAPSLKSRDEGIHAALRVSDAGRQRRDGGQASYFLFQSYYRTCLDNTDRAAPLSRCATQGPDLRTSSWSATQGTTNLADLPGYARSPVSRPAAEGPVRVHERRKRQSNDLQTSTRTWSCHR